MLSKEAIDEYIKIYQSVYGIDIKTADAEREGAKLLRIIQILLKNVPYKKNKIYE